MPILFYLSFLISSFYVYTRHEEINLVQSHTAELGFEPGQCDWGPPLFNISSTVWGRHKTPLCLRAQHRASHIDGGRTEPLLVVFNLQFSSVAQSCPTLCNPMDCSTSGFPVHHQLPELAQTHVCHWWCHLILFKFIVYSDFIELNV